MQIAGALGLWAGSATSYLAHALHATFTTFDEIGNSALEPTIKGIVPQFLHSVVVFLTYNIGCEIEDSLLDYVHARHCKC